MSVNIENFEMNNSNVKKVQEINKKIFVAFKDFCLSHKINYFCIGGTLLGAVRHKGFIPWDDDIDVGLLREDYDKFILLRSEFPDLYVIESAEINPEHKFSFLKIYDRNTTAIEDWELPVKRGLWIDVFPLDKTFNNKIMRGCHFYLVKFLNKIIVTKRKNFHKYNNNNKVSFIGNYFLYYIVFIFPIEFWLRIFDKVIRIKNDDKDAKYVCNFLGRWMQREIVPLEIFKNSVELTFEDFKINAPSLYDDYLRNIYGEYMKLPPVEARVGHEIVGLDLNKGWMD